jgi:hypothetical protein
VAHRCHSHQSVARLGRKRAEPVGQGGGDRFGQWHVCAVPLAERGAPELEREVRIAGRDLDHPGERGRFDGFAEAAADHALDRALPKRPDDDSSQPLGRESHIERLSPALPRSPCCQQDDLVGISETA